MKKQTLLFQTALLTLVGLGLFAPTLVRADASFIEYSAAEGDGDPTELTMNETLSDADTDDVATLTAEGDFLVPSYLLPTERTTTTKPITAIATPTPPRPATSDMPVVVVSGAHMTPAKTSSTTPTAVTTRPIGAESAATAKPGIVTTTPITQPRPAASSAQLPVEPPKPDADQPAPAPTTTVTTHLVEIEEEKPTEPRRPLLLPLAPAPETPAHVVPDVRLTERRIVPSDYVDRMLADLNQNRPTAFKLPQEIRVTFYKNSTAISGQTLKWIRAFALQTIQDPRMAVEIRMSQEDPAVQAQRLALVRNALLGTGLSTHQIQLVYTGRAADSFVLRAAERPENVDVLQKTNGSGKTLEKRTVKW